MHYISVIMSVYNERKEWLIESIESILKQSYSNFEFIIVLDQPENEKLRDLILYYADIDKRVRVVINEKNCGLVHSLNKALSMAKGDLIARMDADDISELNRFEIQVKYLDFTRFDIVGGAMRFINEDGSVLGNSSSYGQSPETCKKSLLFRAVLPHPTWMFRRSVIEDVGFYKHVQTAEDYDLVCRAVSFGKKAVNMPQILLNYRLRDTGVSVGKAYQQNKTMKIIREEFRKSIENNQIYDSEKVIQKISQINYNKAHSYYSISLNIYKDACNIIKTKKIIGSVKMLFSFLINVHNTLHFIETIMLKKINKITHVKEGA